MNWKPGDRAIIVGARKNIKAIGMVVTLIRPITNEWGSGWYVDIPSIVNPGDYAWLYTEHLRPIPDDDSRQVTTWDECEWSPFVTVEQ